MLLEADMCEAPASPAAVIVTLLKLTILRTQGRGLPEPRSNWWVKVTIDGATRYWGFPNVYPGVEYRLGWQRTVSLRTNGSTGRGFEISASGQNMWPGGQLELPAATGIHDVEDHWGILDPTFRRARPAANCLRVDGEYAYVLEYTVEPAA